MVRTFLIYAFMLAWAIVSGILGALLFGWLFGRSE